MTAPAKDLVEALACTRCHELAATRTQVVLGSGSPTAKLLLLGEAPGAEEDLTGMPFVGRSGKLLDRIMAGAGLSREDVYITNVVKCHPPGNRNPDTAEIANCRPWLNLQLEMIRPAVVVTLGNFATRALLGVGAKAGITQLRGKPVQLAGLGLTVLPVFHPAAALRDPRRIADLESDFRQIAAMVAK